MYSVVLFLYMTQAASGIQIREDGPNVSVWNPSSRSMDIYQSGVGHRLYPYSSTTLRIDAPIYMEGRCVYQPIPEYTEVPRSRTHIAYLSTTQRNLMTGTILSLIAILAFWLSKTIKTAQEE